MSKYFSDEEVMCHCGCGGNETKAILLEYADRLREHVGQPLSCSCAYRCPEHNAEVGGVPDSQHVQGLAMDVLVPEGMTVDELADHAIAVGFDGIGRYYDDGFVHCDVRDNGESPNTYTWEG